MRRTSSAGGIVTGAVLVGLGIIFLFGQFLPADLADNLWPFLVVGVGIAFFVGMVSGGRPAASLAIPGSIITTVGLILLVQNTFDRWESWSYAWALVVAAVGAGIFLAGVWGEREDSRSAGLAVAGIGLVLFLVLGALFEFGSRVAYERAAGLVWPVVLIALGMYLLIRRTAAPARPQPFPPPPAEPVTGPGGDTAGTAVEGRPAPGAERGAS